MCGFGSPASGYARFSTGAGQLRTWWQSRLRMQPIVWALLLVSSFVPVFASSANTTCGGPTVEIHRDNLWITLDSRFPRVLSYEVKGRGRLLGARENSQALIDLNNS